jgi:hypothetical protein
MTKSLRGALIAVACIAVVGLLMLLQVNSAIDRSKRTLQLTSYCQDTFQSTNGDFTTCFTWADAHVDDAAIVACNRRSPDLDASFYQCLQAEGIITP